MIRTMCKQIQMLNYHFHSEGFLKQNIQKDFRWSDKKIFRLYLCQTSLILCGIVSFFFPSVRGPFAHNLFATVYGFAAGGLNYSLKMHLFEMSKSRHFALIWSCLRGFQCVGVGVGVSTFGLFTGNVEFGQYFGGIFLFLAASLLLIGERCRQFHRYRKCPLHDDLNVDKQNVENEDSTKKENGNQNSTRKTSEEMFRAYFGIFCRFI